MDMDNLKDLMARATPGPWSAKSSAMGDNDIGILGDGGCLAECFSSIRKQFEHATDEQAANAALIAMAPDLAAEVLRLNEQSADLWTANLRLISERDKAVAANHFSPPALSAIRMVEAIRLDAVTAQRDEAVALLEQAVRLAPNGPFRDACAAFLATAPDLASAVLRLTAERDAAVAANQALVTENARLVGRVDEARGVIQKYRFSVSDDAMDECDRMASAFLAGGK